MLFHIVAHAKGPVVVPVTGNYNVAFEDIQFIKYTLASILLAALGFIIKGIVSLFFKKQDSDGLKLDRVIEAITRLEGNVSYLERHTVKKEDLIMLVRTELNYRKSVKNDDDE